jgi:hypothetical protein
MESEVNRSARFLPVRIQIFHLGAGPGRAAEKGEAGLDARIKEEATDRNTPAQLFPAKLLDEFREKLLERHAVQGIVGGRHGEK